MCAAGHLEGGPPTERQEQNASGVGARQHEMGDTVRERVGFPRAGAGDDEQWPGAELGSLPLLWIQRGECGRVVHLPLTIARLSPFSSPLRIGRKGLRRLANPRIVLDLVSPFASRRGWPLAPFVLALLLASACKGPEAAPPAKQSQEKIQWEAIRTWSGRGSQYLDSFPAEGALRIEWDAKREVGAKTPGNIQIVVHSAISGRALAGPVVDHAGAGKGIAYFSEEPRTFFVSVISEDLDWKVSVSERLR